MQGISILLGVHFGRRDHPSGDRVICAAMLIPERKVRHSTDLTAAQPKGTCITHAPLVGPVDYP